MDPFASALEQSAAVRARDASATELVEMYLRRIERYNPQLNAYWLTTDELARQQATAASEHPLAGAAVSVKDIVPMAGYPCTYGSRAFADNVAQVDHFVVMKLKESGCPILGRTTTPEFGSRPITEFGLHGAARNPWNRDHTTGGSSGGAAAALAAGLCAWSHGTDGGGSVRIPASCCGLVGLKPSRGRISMGPLLGEGWAGLSTQGVIARTVADAAAGLDTLAGHLPGDPYWADPEGSFRNWGEPGELRVAFSLRAQVAIAPEAKRAVREAADALAGQGHHLEEDGPDTLAFRDPMLTIVRSGTASFPVSDTSVLDPINQLAFADENEISGADYVRAVNLLRAHSRTVVAFWDRFDALLTPTLTQPPPVVGRFGTNPETAHQESFDWLSFTYPCNCTGQPAITLPLGQTDDGLPIGVQLVGPPRGERVILALAAQLEQAMPWRDRRPPGFA